MKNGLQNSPTFNMLSCYHLLLLSFRVGYVTLPMNFFSIFHETTSVSFCEGGGLRYDTGYESMRKLQMCKQRC